MRQVLLASLALLVIALLYSAWMRLVPEESSAPGAAPLGAAAASDEQLLLEAVYLGLRTTDGVDIGELPRRFPDATAGIDVYLNNHWVVDLAGSYRGGTGHNEGINYGIASVGLSYMFADAPFDLFVEIVPILDLVPDTDFDLNAAIGVRWYP